MGLAETFYNPSLVKLEPGHAVVYGFLNYSDNGKEATPRVQLQVGPGDVQEILPFTMHPEDAERVAQLLDRITLAQCKGIALLLRDGSAKARLDLVKFNKEKK